MCHSSTKHNDKIIMVVQEVLDKLDYEVSYITNDYKKD